MQHHYCSYYYSVEHNHKHNIIHYSLLF
uniref:Uncharacterized protein n=1 Tax=Anguilla anguilla TaxID=7936 RepID=A0A0E9T9B9_ANGAN